MPRLIALALALSACTARPSAPEPELQLRSYKVPPGAAQQLRSVIRGVLFLEKDRSIGGAQVAGDGQLVVLASPGIQQGVESLIAGFPAVSGPPSIELTYWVLRTLPLEAGKAAPPLAAELQELQPALQAVADKPPREVRLVERLRLTSMSDEHAELKGRALEVSQKATAIGDRVVAELRLHPLGKEATALETRVQLEAGQTLVLAAAGLREEIGEVVFVVRASVLKGR